MNLWLKTEITTNLSNTGGPDILAIKLTDSTSLGGSSASTWSFAQVTSYSASFNTTQTGGVFTVPNGLYHYVFYYGTTNATSTQRVQLGVRSSNGATAILVSNGWNYSDNAKTTGAFNVTDGTVGLAGMRYSAMGTLTGGHLLLTRIG